MEDLEEHGVEASLFHLLLYKHFEILVNDRYCEKNSSTRSDRTYVLEQHDNTVPIRSAATVRAPMTRPPRYAATGIILLSSLYMDPSLCPRMIICCSLSIFATSRGEVPDTSIQALAKSALAVKTNATYKMKCMGSLKAS